MIRRRDLAAAGAVPPVMATIPAAARASPMRNPLILQRADPQILRAGGCSASTPPITARASGPSRRPFGRSNLSAGRAAASISCHKERAMRATINAARVGRSRSSCYGTLWGCPPRGFLLRTRAGSDCAAQPFRAAAAQRHGPGAALIRLAIR